MCKVALWTLRQSATLAGKGKGKFRSELKAKIRAMEGREMRSEPNGQHRGALALPNA